MMKDDHACRSALRPLAAVLMLLAGSRNALGGDAACGWSWTFDRPLRTDDVVAVSAAWATTADGITRLTATGGPSGSITFTNVVIDVDVYPVLRLDVADADDSWQLLAGLHGASPSNLHQGTRGGHIAVDLRAELGWSGQQAMDIRIVTSNRVDLGALRVGLPPGWVRFDDFDTHHWVGMFGSLSNAPNPLEPQNAGWLHPLEAAYSAAHPSEGRTALKVGVPIVPGISNNFMYCTTVLPEPEDWSDHRLFTFDPYLEEAPMVLPSGRLQLRNAAGQVTNVPLILGWQLFQWENRQVTFPLQGNLPKGLNADGTTNWQIYPVPIEILSNVIEVTFGFDYYSDPVLSNNSIHVDNLRLDGVKPWDLFEGPQYGWRSTNAGVLCGITANRTLHQSAGSLCIRWDAPPGPVSAQTESGSWEQNWSPYGFVRASVHPAQPDTDLRLVVNHSATTTVATAGPADEWTVLTWNLPAGVSVVTSLAIEVLSPPAQGKVYVDELLVGGYTSRVDSIRAFALKNGNRIVGSLSDTNALSLRVQARTNGLPAHAGDGATVTNLPMAGLLDFAVHHADLGNDATYFYAAFVEYAPGEFTPLTADSVAKASRHILPVAADAFDAGFSKINGALLYIEDKATGRNLCYGNEGMDLWHVVFVNETLPVLHASQFRPGGETLGFSFEDDPPSLVYSYRSGTQSLHLAVSVATPGGSDLQMVFSITNRTAEAIRTVCAPRLISFAATNLQRVVFPILEGVAFTKSFFEENRYTYLPRPWLFSDFVGVESADGLLSFFVVQDSTYGSDILPPVATRPVFQPSNFGLGASKDAADMAVVDYEMMTYVPAGGSWSSPTLVLRTGGDSVRDAVAHYKSLNGFDDTNRYSTLRQKLEPFGLHERIARSTILAIECHLAVEWQKAPWGGLWSAVENEWLSTLPPDNVLHFTHWQDGMLEHRHPDCQPVLESKFGASNDLVRLLDTARSSGRFTVMPFTDWCVWNKPEDLWTDGSGAVIPRPEACTKLWNPDVPLREYWGYMVKPWHTNVYAVNSNMFMYYKTALPSDLLFCDVTCEWSWRYTRADTDGDGFDESILTGYTQGLVDQNRHLKQFLPVFTEGVLDIMMGEVAGFCASVRQKWTLGILEHMGEEFEDWTVFPLAADVAHRNVGFYQHDLNSQVFPNTKKLLTHYSVMGYNYITDVATWYKERNARGENWMEICDAFQKAVASRHFGVGLNRYEPAIGGNPRLILTSFGTGADEITILANFQEQDAFTTNGCAIAPEGFLATMPNGRVTAGIFTNLFNGGTLSPGEHFVAIERVAPEEIAVRHPQGADTPVRIPRPSAWTNRVFAVAVLEDGAEVLAPDALTVSDADLVLQAAALTSKGERIRTYRLLDAPLSADLPPSLLASPEFEIENSTQVWVMVSASAPVRAIVRYGTADGAEYAVTNEVLSLSHAMLIGLPSDDEDYWFTVEVVDTGDRSVSTGRKPYPAQGVLWEDTFSQGRNEVWFDLAPRAEKDLVVNAGDFDDDVFSEDPGAIHCFVEDGFGGADGLPTNRLISSHEADLGSYRLLPYGGANAIELAAGGPTEEHHLRAPARARYQKLGILAAAAYGDASFTLTCHYGDGTSTPIWWETEDWYAPTEVPPRGHTVIAITSMDRAVASTRAVDPAQHFHLYEFVIDAGGLNTNKELVGITIGNNPSWCRGPDTSYGAVFAVAGHKTDWRDRLTDPDYNALLAVSNGLALMSVTGAPPGGHVEGKVQSRELTVDFNQFPILEVSIPRVTLGWPSKYWIRLQETVPPWNYVDVMDSDKPGTMILDVPRLTGWTGSRQLVVEFWLYNTTNTVMDISVDFVRFRKDANRAWQDDFAPPKSTWEDAETIPSAHALLTDNGDGTATVRQNEHPEGWGAVYSEMVVLDADRYPWITADVPLVTNRAEGANFAVAVNDMLSSDYATVLGPYVEGFRESGRLPRFHTGAVERLKMSLVIGGSNQLAIIDNLQIRKRIPEEPLLWDILASPVKIGQGQPLWLAFPATEYGSRDVQYRTRFLPAGAVYDGVLRWQTPTMEAGTFRFELIADNGLTAITNYVTVTVTNDAVQIEAPRWEQPWLATDTNLVTFGGTYAPETTNVIVEVSVNGGLYDAAAVSLTNGTFTWQGLLTDSPTYLRARAKDKVTEALSSEDRCDVYSSMFGPAFLLHPGLETRDATSVWVLVKAATQATASVIYGVEDAQGQSVSSTNLSLTHALLVPSLPASSGTWFQVVISNAAGCSMISSKFEYPPAGVRWCESFDEQPQGWKAELGATLRSENGKGVLEFAAPGTWAKADSPMLEVDVDQFPILEVCITNSMWPGAYEIGLQAAEGPDPWPYFALVNDSLAGTAVVDIRELTGWSGTRKFFVELRLYKGESDTNRVYVDYVKLHAEANTAWRDDFGPPRPSWGYEMFASLTNHGDGTARLAQVYTNGWTWGWVCSELLTLDAHKFPWITVGVKAMDNGARFGGLIEDERRTNYIPAISEYRTNFVEWGAVPKNRMHALDKIRAVLSIEGSNMQARVDEVEIAKRAPGVSLTWDRARTSFKAGPGEAVMLPMTATDYEGHSVVYRSTRLPQGGAYDGFFRWTTPGQPGTYRFEVLADNQLTVITNRIALTVTNDVIRYESPEWDASWARIPDTDVVEYGTWIPDGTNLVLEVSVDGGPYGTADVSRMYETFVWTGSVSASPVTLDARVREPGTGRLSSTNSCRVYSESLGPSFVRAPVIEARDATSVWVLVRADTQSQARVWFGREDPRETSVPSTNPALTHAVVAWPVDPALDYWFQVEIANTNGHAMISDPVYYPGAGAAWRESFSDAPAGWELFSGVTLSAAGGVGILRFPTGTVGKALSPEIVVDLDQYPILEISIVQSNMSPDVYQVWLLERENEWSETFLVEEDEPATLLLNIPRLTGWSGMKRFSVQFLLWRNGNITNAIHIDDIRVRADGNIGWEDAFAPLRATWGGANQAVLSNNGDGMATLRQDGPQGWGSVSSELLVFDANEYPWVTVDVAAVTNADLGAVFKMNVHDAENEANYTTAVQTAEAPFKGSGPIPKWHPANTLDRVRLAMVIGGQSQTAIVDRVEINKRLQDREIRWDAQPSIFTAFGCTDIAIPFTVTDYENRPVQYSAVSLPPGATYDGVLRWLTPPRPGTNVFTFVADNGLVSITSVFTVCVGPVLFECAGFRGPDEESFLLSWGAVSGETYRVMYKNDLRAPDPWQRLPGDVNATGSVAAAADDTFGTNRWRYYQIRQVWGPDL